MVGYIYPATEQMVIVNEIEAGLANATVHLMQAGLTFTPQTNAADLATVEANFTGYANITLGNLAAAFPDSVNGGTSFMIPTQTFICGANVAVGNDIFGGWIQLAGGGVFMAWQTNAPYQMQSDYQALPIEILLNYFGDGSVNVQYAGVPQ